MELFKLEPGLAIWTWVVFGVLFFLLRKYLLPPLLGSIKTREELIAKSVDKVALIDRRLAEIEAEHKELLRRTNDQADEILRRSREEAEVVHKRLLEKAEEEARRVVAEARERMAEEKEALIESLRLEIADFVCDASEKLIGRAFVAEKDREWAKDLARTL